MVQRSNINVSLGQTADVGLKLEVGELSEIVIVEGVVPGTWTSGAPQTAASSTATSCAQCPSGGESATSVTHCLAWATPDRSDGRTRRLPAPADWTMDLFVDGVNITNQGFGALGLYWIVFGSLGNAIPFDFFKEVQLKTGGYEADFGQAVGGVVNVITKSGTNNLRGSLFGYTWPQSLEGTWKQYQLVNGTVQTLSSQLHDAGVEGGGPVTRTVSSSSARLIRNGKRKRCKRQRGALSSTRMAKIVSVAISGIPRRPPRNSLMSIESTPHSLAIRRTGDMGPQRPSSLACVNNLFFQRNQLRRPQPDCPLPRSILGTAAGSSRARSPGH